METGKELLKIIEELEIYEKNELMELYNNRNILQEKENRLLKMEEELYNFKQHVKMEMDDETIEAAYIKIAKIKEFLNGMKLEEMESMVKPISNLIIEELEL